MDEEALAAETVRRGFNNVIDAFHVVGSGDVAVRFYHDERRSPTPGVRLTDELFKLGEDFRHRNLPLEVEARWRLVETAWELNLPIHTLGVTYDSDAEGLLVVQMPGRQRVSITGCRDALNGYQKGKCFYCFGPISIREGDGEAAEVDHFFPHRLKGQGVVEDVDGFWNPVLACQTCNRGLAGKFGLVPEVQYVERLHRRNEFLINSHHPLRETLMRQAGMDEASRRGFLAQAYTGVVGLLVQKWSAGYEWEPAF